MFLSKLSCCFLQLLQKIREEGQSLSVRERLKVSEPNLNRDRFEKYPIFDSSFMDSLTCIIYSFQDDILITCICRKGTFMAYRFSHPFSISNF